MWCSAADTHLKLLDRAVSDVEFLTGVVFECDIAHCRSVAILCVLYKIRCYPVNPNNGALSGPYVPMRITRVALVAHRLLMLLLAIEPRSTGGLLFPFLCHSGPILLTSYTMVWDCRVSRAGPLLSYWRKLLYPYYSLILFSPFSSFCLLVGIVGLGSSD